MFDFQKLQQEAAKAAADEAAKTSKCGEPPAVLSASALERYAGRCGNDSALSFLSKELGVKPETLRDAASGKVDWKKAAIEALNLEGLAGIAGAGGIFDEDGDLDWQGVAMSVGGTAAMQGCLAAGAATGGVTAALSPLCGAIGGALAGLVVDGIEGIFGEESEFVPGRFAAWHTSPLTMLAFGAQYLSRAGYGPVSESYAYSLPTDFIAYAAELNAASTPLSIYYSIRQTVLEVCAAIDAAIVIWETGTGQSISLVAEKEGKTPWKYVFDSFQENKLGFDTKLFYMLTRNWGDGPGVFPLRRHSNGTVDGYVHLHDLASFAKDRGKADNYQRYVEDPTLLAVDNAFYLTRYDDLAWQQQNGVVLGPNASLETGELTLLFTYGYADYYTDTGLSLLSGMTGCVPGRASGCTSQNVMFTDADYKAPTRGWLWSIGPFAGSGNKDYAVRPAALWSVTTDIFSYEELRSMAEEIHGGAFSTKEKDWLTPADQWSGASQVEGWYLFPPGSYWSRNLYFSQFGIWPEEKAIGAVSDRMMRIWSVGTKMPWSQQDFTWPIDAESATFQQYQDGIEDGAFDRLHVVAHKALFRNCVRAPERIVRWSAALRERLDRCLGILRQYIRHWRRENLGADGLPKQGAAPVLALDTAMGKTAAIYDFLTEKDGGGKESAVDDRGVVPVRPRYVPPGWGTYALVFAGSVGLVVGGYYAWRALSGGRRSGNG